MVLALTELPEVAPLILGHSSWRRIEQPLVDEFADLTDDRQRIHVDQDYAATTLFGGTVAHGYLVVSLIPSLFREILTVTGVGAAVNYGADRLRFPGPVPVGSNIRAAAELRSAEQSDRGCLARVRVQIEVEGQVRPGCILDAVWLYSF